jgi:hypothetical protein
MFRLSWIRGLEEVAWRRSLVRVLLLSVAEL